jgi:hypothetical protein
MVVDDYLHTYLLKYRTFEVEVQPDSTHISLPPAGVID